MSVLMHRAAPFTRWTLLLPLLTCLALVLACQAVELPAHAVHGLGVGPGGLVKRDDAEVIAHKIARMFQRPFELEQREIFATTSIGVAVFPQDGDGAESLLQSADTAMYRWRSGPDASDSCHGVVRAVAEKALTYWPRSEGLMYG